MKFDIERSLDLPLPIASAWGLLERIETVAACMPGAKITERVDDSHYKGAVTVKLGPATVNFKGDLEVLGMDAASHEIKIAGRAADGASSAATLQLTATLASTGAASSRITGRSEVSINGKVATFGARLMNTVADQLIGQFYANLLKQAEALTVEQPADAAAPVAAVPAPTKLNALALAWAVIKDFLVSLVSRRRTT
jgi:hypothetical protein